MNLDQKDWFHDIETIVSEPLKFKAKLAIGEDAFKTLKFQKVTSELWDVFGVAMSAAKAAKSTMIASTFFAPSGILASMGIGATAVTPIGWVIAFAIIASGSWFGITRYFKSYASSKVTVIPNFINTPMDILAVGLFDLLAPLALKVAAVDENIADSEKTLINDYLIKEWGYDKTFVKEGLLFTEKNLPTFSIKELALILGEFTKKNPDCNYKAMSEELLGFIKDIIEEDGKIDGREKRAIEEVKNIFAQGTIKRRLQCLSIYFNNLIKKKTFAKES